MKKFIIISYAIIFIAFIVSDVSVGHFNYIKGHDAGVKEGLQAYANHMSDILSGDYKFCQLNGDPLVVATESGHLTFMCKKGDFYYGYANR